jgi:hypothetical protein
MGDIRVINLTNNLDLPLERGFHCEPAYLGNSEVV